MSPRWQEINVQYRETRFGIGSDGQVRIDTQEKITKDSSTFEP